MSIDGSDILFDFFFRQEVQLFWLSCENDLGLGVISAGQNSSSTRLNIGSGQEMDIDTRYPVEISLAVDSDISFSLQAISVSALQLDVEKSGWTDSGFALVLYGPGVTGGSQTLMTVREEDRFTN